MKKILVLLVVSIFAYYGCTKSEAQSFKTSACGCSDSSGLYVPTVSGTGNISSIVQVGTAHFIRSGNQCSVWGRVALVATNATVTHTVFTLSLPFPSTFTNVDDATGHLTAVQGINNITAGFVNVNPANTIIFFWDQVFQAGTNVYYSFTYTIK
jgi:hypothetical protein